MRLLSQDGAIGGCASIGLRPYEVVLLEVVPEGASPSLDRVFKCRDIVARFEAPSREVAVTAQSGAREDLPVPLEEGPGGPDELPPKRSVTMRCRIPGSAPGGILMVSVEMTAEGLARAIPNVGSHFAARALVNGVQSVVLPVLGLRTFDAPWQGWRIPVAPTDLPQEVELMVSARLKADVEMACRAHFVPGDGQKYRPGRRQEAIP